MTLIAQLVRALAASGATPDQIAAAVEVVELQQIAKEEERKAKGRERVRRHRERNDEKRSVTLQNVTDVTPPNSPPKDPTPQNTPPLSPRSETNVSGADAPNIVAFDPRADLFSRGVEAVIGMTGKAAPQAKTMIGHWLKLVSDEAIVVLRAIDEAVDHRPANPTAWIEGRLRKAGRGPPQGSRPRAAEGFL